MSVSFRMTACTTLLVSGLALWVAAVGFPAHVGYLHQEQLRVLGTVFGGGSIAAGIFVAAARPRKRSRRSYYYTGDSVG